MADIKIKIRRGSTIPSETDLSDYELGYVTGTNELYIKDGANGIKKIGGGSGVEFIPVSPLSYDSNTKQLSLTLANSVTSDSNLPVTASAVYTAIQSCAPSIDNLYINCGGAMSDEL